MLTRTPWFKRKVYGWGWMPSTWQGWLIMAIYLAFIIPTFLSIDAQSHSGSDTLIGFALPFIIATTLLSVICYATGEKPHWQWGRSDTTTSQE